jgi:hexulose-6-phosphate isomerase
MHNRRAFLKSVAALAASPNLAGAFAAQQTPSPGAAAGAPRIRKSTLISMLPRSLSYEQRFTLAREAGFEGVEMRTITRDEEAAEIREASVKTGLRIHSVMNADHWEAPLSSADPEVVRRSVRGMETSLRNAALWGADAVLLVPAVVDAATSYRDAYTRSQRIIREQLIPKAAEHKVVIAVEEVWNKFLLSPLEFARYVDEFESQWVKAYFDVGNVVLFAFPQDWIRTLGARIVKVHLKDFTMNRKESRYAFVNLGEGDIDWPEVRRALGEIKYSGYVTTELSGPGSTDPAAYLKDVSARVDRILAGEKPVVKSL